MSEQVTTLIISLAPSIGAVVTVVVSMVKLIKSFGDNTSKLKSIVTTQTKELSTFATNQAKLIANNENLTKQIADLTAKLDESMALNDKVDNLLNEVENTSNRLNLTVQDTLNKGIAGVEQIKKDINQIGE